MFAHYPSGVVKLPTAILVSAVLAGALLFGLGGGVARADLAAAEKHSQKGMAAYAVENWELAIKEFQDGFIEEQRPGFLFNIAQAHRMAGHRAEAVRFYQRYLDLNPRAADRGKVEQYIRELKQAIAADKDAPPPHVEPPSKDPVVPVPPSPPPPRPFDSLGVSLTAAGLIAAAGGAALIVVAAVQHSQANDHSMAMGTQPTDLGVRQSQESQANALGIAGYSVLGVGAAVAASGIIRLALRPRMVANKDSKAAMQQSPKTQLDVGVSAAPGQCFGVLRGTF